MSSRLQLAGNGHTDRAPERTAADLDDLTSHYVDDYDVLCKVAYSIVRSREEAHDAVQQAYTDTAEKIKRNVAIYNLSGWLYRVVQYESRMRLRRRPTQPLTDELGATGESSPSQIAMMHGSCEEIFEALKALKPVQRSTFLLAAVHGYDYREIAVKTGRSEEGVRQLIYRARRQLRDSVDSMASS